MTLSDFASVFMLAVWAGASLAMFGYYMAHEARESYNDER